MSVSNSATALVKRLCEFLKGTRRNITTGDWFTRMELLDSLYSNKLTLIDTIRKNKRELPEEFARPDKKRPVKFSMFGFRQYATLLQIKLAD